MCDSDTKAEMYLVPKREVLIIPDMSKWLKSEAYHEYVGFVLAMNEAVKSKRIDDAQPPSEVCRNLISLLDKLDQWITEIPPIQQPQRFGNKSFRTWLEKLKSESEGLLKSCLLECHHPAIVELLPYLNESFGNITRIDYGTGHEMSFAMFLVCLFKIGALKEEDSTAVVCLVFNRYLVVMRHLLLTYNLEPAGSHGVWSLDDYQFLPFIWGSSQLVDHPKIEPKSYPNEGVAEKYGNEFIFMGCIEFINKVKTGPFAEHSNQLWNISGVSTWSKVNAGLVKMYKKEVLEKFPVIQHVVFGSLLPIRPHSAAPSPP